MAPVDTYWTTQGQTTPDRVLNNATPASAYTTTTTGMPYHLLPGSTGVNIDTPQIYADAAALFPVFDGTPAQLTIGMAREIYGAEAEEAFNEAATSTSCDWSWRLRSSSVMPGPWRSAPAQRNRWTGLPAIPSVAGRLAVSSSFPDCWLLPAHSGAPRASSGSPAHAGSCRAWVS